MTQKEVVEAPIAKTPVEAANERALAAVADVIIHLLKSDSKQRFAEAARMCQIGQSLVRSQAKRMQDFALLEVDDVADDELAGQVGGARNYRMPNVAYNGPNDERELQRNFMLTFGGNAQVQAEAQKATIAENEARELQSLMTLLPSLPTNQQAIMNARIQRLFDNMEARNARPEMVSSDVPRGHSAGEGEPQGDGAPGVRADANGRAGDGEVAFACRQEDVGV